MTSTKKRLSAYFKAGYAGIFLKSYEEQRVEAELLAVAAEIDFKLYVWTITGSLVGPIVHDPQEPPTIWNGDDGAPLDPIGLLQKMNKLLPEKAIVLAKDYHLFTNEANPFLVRHMKDCLSEARNNLRRLVILGCQFKLVTELEKEFTMVEFELPDRDELKGVLQGIADSAKVHMNGNTDKILDAACGMTTTEAADAFALSVIESGGTDIPPEVVAREKSNVVRKNGLLEIVEPNTKLEDIGGLEVLKGDLWDKRLLFTKEARDYGLTAPRGVLVCGQGGTGKSLTATACGAIFNIPLVRLEAGKIYGSLVGQSESNWRAAYGTAKAIAPCVLWCDEAEALFVGVKSSGATDGGTTNRVVKAVLQDMQSAIGIFFFFTANDIDGFPDPLIDRLDVWSVDLPTNAEREQIWKIHIAKRKRDPKNFSITTLAKVTEGFSGRQIEQIWLAAMCSAFNDSMREPTNDDITRAASKCVATSITMAQQIDARRKRLEGRARPAGIAEASTQSERKSRKLSV